MSESLARNEDPRRDKNRILWITSRWDLTWKNMYIAWLRLIYEIRISRSDVKKEVVYTVNWKIPPHIYGCSQRRVAVCFLAAKENNNSTLWSFWWNSWKIFITLMELFLANTFKNLFIWIPSVCFDIAILNEYFCYRRLTLSYLSWKRYRSTGFVGPVPVKRVYIPEEFTLKLSILQFFLLFINRWS